MSVLDALQYASETVSKPRRAVTGVLSGLTGGPWGGGLLNLLPFSDTLGITNPQEDVEGRQLLEQWGALDPNQAGLDAGDVGGFLFEEALDPVNYAGGFLLKKLLGIGSKVAMEAPKLAEQGTEAGRAAEALLSQIRNEDEAVRWLTEPEASDLVSLEAMPWRQRYQEWLGKHALKSPEGNPLPLYHGTSGQFEEFDPTKFGTGFGGNWRGKGAYLTDDPVVASRYATESKMPFGLAEDPAQWHPNVRMHHAIGEKVLDTSAPLDASTIQMLRAELGPRSPAYLRTVSESPEELVRLSNAEYRRASDIRIAIEKETGWLYDDVINSDQMSIRYGKELDEIDRLEHNAHELMEDFRAAKFGGGVPPEAPYNIEELLKRIEYVHPEFLSSAATNAGYDAIRYPGGAVTRSRPHNAFVVPDVRNVVPRHPTPSQFDRIREQFKGTPKELWGLLIGSGLIGSALTGDE